MTLTDVIYFALFIVVIAGALCLVADFLLCGHSIEEELAKAEQELNNRKRVKWPA